VATISQAPTLATKVSDVPEGAETLQKVDIQGTSTSCCDDSHKYYWKQQEASHATAKRQPWSVRKLITDLFTSKTT
jgi:hypothetical protein